MPFPMRIQPIDSIRSDVVKPPVKSRLKRLFDRPFTGVLKISSAEKPVAGGEKDGVAMAAVAEFEPSSVCLDKMVQNFIEDNNEKQSTTAAVKCGRNRCNCFNGNSNDSSDDELDFFSDSVSANSSFSDPSDTLKSLIPCASVAERNLLADTSKIVEKNNKTCKGKDDLRKIVTDGEYEYIDVIIEGERVLIDVDFRSEFEIARSTSSYKAILQSLPYIFVGKSDRLLQIVSIASEAARQSLKKKGMHIAPWRKSEYMKSKWLSPHTRITQLKPTNPAHEDAVEETTVPKPEPENQVLECEVGELDLIFGEKTNSSDESNSEEPKSPVKEEAPPSMTWQLPAVRPKSLERGNKVVVTGLASLLKEKL
ncbi:UNVERIFIED_CONTAM: hypothetical protein Sradi_2733200 [Sesamum radiatum]|uniref:Uncharacterized protein n=1 Tax=Sesamum radiatum TaxID=300843 RepID=A0AAW2S7S3_SESRA